MDRVMDVSDVVAWERRIEQSGTSLLELMTRAGDALVLAAGQLVPSESRIVILCGSGNNGGDGWVAARRLAAASFKVSVITRTEADEIKAHPAHEAAVDATARGGFDICVDPDSDRLAAILGQANLVIDALLGTGFTHVEVRQPYARWISQANQTRQERGIIILAADCPSGLNAQTGQAAHDCIMADHTVTMLAVKTGMTLPQAQSYVGTLSLARLGQD